MPDAESVLSRFLGREVRLVTAAPADYTIAEYRPDIEGLNPAGERDVLVEQVLGAAFFTSAGLPSAVPEGSLVDLFPISVLTTSTLEWFALRQPSSDWDRRRFRMNVIIRSPLEGLPEQDWLGRPLSIGDTTLVGAIPTPRCMMPNLAQDDLPQDLNILKTIARHNQQTVVGGGTYPCLGIYAAIAAPGTLRTGDLVG